MLRLTMKSDMQAPQSRRDVVRRHFSSFDLDGDGRIDRKEFGALLETLGAGLSAAEADHAFADIDADGNGAIDFDEFCRYWRVED